MARMADEYRLHCHSTAITSCVAVEGDGFGNLIRTKGAARRAVNGFLQHLAPGLRSLQAVSKGVAVAVLSIAYAAFLLTTGGTGCQGRIEPNLFFSGSPTPVVDASPFRAWLIPAARNANIAKTREDQAA